MTNVLIKLNGKRKIWYYDVQITPTDNGIILAGKDEEMLIPYGSLEYLIVREGAIKNEHR